MRPSFRLFGGQFGPAAQLKSYPFPKDLFQCLDVSLRCPYLQFCISGSAQAGEVLVWPRVEIHG
jgi:hypothetical protein